MVLSSDALVRILTSNVLSSNFPKTRNKFESPWSNFELSIKRASYIFPILSSAPRPIGAAYVPILLSEVEEEQRPSGNGDREAIVVEVGLCYGEGERAYTGYAHISVFRFL